MLGYLSFMLELAKVNDYHVYHTLAPIKAYHILRNNELKLPLAETNASESKFGAKLFYMSFARTPASGYIADRAPGLRAVNEQVLFVFDYRKLKNKRGVIFKPVDYWGVNEDGRTMGGATKEAEERMFSDSPVIKGILDCLTEVRIITDFDKYSNNRWLLEVVIAAKKNKIPVKLFETRNKQGFLLGKEKPEEHAEIYKQLKAGGFSDSKLGGSSEARRASIIRKKFPEYGGRNWLLILAEYVYKTEYTDLSKDARDILYYQLRTKNEFIQYYAADIHNMRTGVDSDKKKFHALLKATKSKSVVDFFSFIYDKWKKIEDAHFKR